MVSRCDIDGLVAKWQASHPFIAFPEAVARLFI